VVVADSHTFKALSEAVHEVGGRSLILMPFKNEDSIRNESNHYSRRRICVSKVSGSLSPDFLKHYFEKYGPVDNFFEIEPPKK
jgi:hypothetical protein